MTTTIYGIKNCDTMKKARKWLDEHGVEVRFYDYKVEGIDKERLAQWARRLGWETLLNRSGTTFRKLPESRKAVIDEAAALRLMQEQPSLIKRPVLERDGKLLVGFKEDAYAQLFP